MVFLSAHNGQKHLWSHHLRSLRSPSSSWSSLPFTSPQCHHFLCLSHSLTPKWEMERKKDNMSSCQVRGISLIYRFCFYSQAMNKYWHDFRSSRKNKLITNPLFHYKSQNSFSFQLMSLNAEIWPSQSTTVIAWVVGPWAGGFWWQEAVHMPQCTIHVLSPLWAVTVKVGSCG